MIDAHVHVWSDERARYPFAPHDGLGVPDAPRTPTAFIAVAQRQHVRNALLIQPRVYGYDHSFLFEVASVADETFRVMPLVNVVRTTSIREIRTYAAHASTAGVRVIALGDQPAQWLASEEASRAWQELSQLELPVGMLVDPVQLSLIETIAAAHPDLTIIDHMARLRQSSCDEWLPVLCGLAHHVNVVVKLSAVASLSNRPYPHSDMWPLIQSLYDAFGSRRLLWGSDWPHVDPDGGYEGNCAAVLDALSNVPQGDLDDIFGGTAARLLGFTSRNIQETELQ